MGQKANPKFFSYLARTSDGRSCLNNLSILRRLLLTRFAWRAHSWEDWLKDSLARPWKMCNCFSLHVRVSNPEDLRHLINTQWQASQWAKWEWTKLVRLCGASFCSSDHWEDLESVKHAYGRNFPALQNQLMKISYLQFHFGQSGSSWPWNVEENKFRLRFQGSDDGFLESQYLKLESN